MTTSRSTRYERARMLGARSLQIASGAPVLVPVEGPSVDPVAVAEAEAAALLLPITVHDRPRRPDAHGVVLA